MSVGPLTGLGSKALLGHCRKENHLLSLVSPLGSQEWPLVQARYHTTLVPLPCSAIVLWVCANTYVISLGDKEHYCRNPLPSQFPSTTLKASFPSCSLGFPRAKGYREAFLASVEAHGGLACPQGWWLGRQPTNSSLLSHSSRAKPRPHSFPCSSGSLYTSHPDIHPFPCHYGNKGEVLSLCGCEGKSFPGNTGAT